MLSRIPGTTTLLSILLLSVTVVGCDKEGEKTTAPAQDTGPTAAVDANVTPAPSAADDDPDAMDEEVLDAMQSDDEDADVDGEAYEDEGEDETDDDGEEGFAALP